MRRVPVTRALARQLKLCAAICLGGGVPDGLPLRHYVLTKSRKRAQHGIWRRNCLTWHRVLSD